MGFYFNYMTVAGSSDDVQLFLDEVGIPAECVGQNDGTDCDEFDGANKRLNDERYAEFTKMVKDATKIDVDRVRTQYHKNGVQIDFDSRDWDGTAVCIVVGQRYSHLRFLIQCENDPHGGMVLRLHGLTWEAWSWVEGDGPEDEDDYRCLGYGALSCFGDHIWERIGRPGEAPVVTEKIPSPRMALINDTGDFFGEPCQDDVPRTATSLE